MASPIHSLNTNRDNAWHAELRPAAGARPAAGSAAAPSSTATDSAPSFAAAFIAASEASASAAVAASTTPAAPATSSTPSSTSTAGDSNDPAGPLFGANPWMADPTGDGPNGYVTHYNPIYFATPQTAQTVAQMLGGTVTQSVQMVQGPGSPFGQDEYNLMVQLPNGGTVNPGLIADIYTHGWPQSFVDQQVANEVAGAVPAVNS